MAHAAIRGLRRWTHQQMQPLYDQLPSVEMDDELKNDVSVEIGSSSSSESSRRNSDGNFNFGREGGKTAGLARGPLAIPMLLVRFGYLCWLLVTEPVRRRGRHWGSSWPTVYGKLEEFTVLVPSFLQPVKPGFVARPLHPTAWLDGLRGVAAFFVVWHHASLLWFGWHIHLGYGSNKDENWFIQLPIVRLAVSGPPHVAIFFVVSGYALSYKPLRLSRQGRFAEAGEAINSSVFRRHTRLFLMPTVITFIVAIMTYLDLYGTKNWKNVAIPSRRPPQPGTLAGQLSHWFQSIISLTNPLSKNMSRGGKFVYDPNLWTLPVEFDCSLMLFLCQAAFNRFRPRMRMLFMFGITTFAMRYIYWQPFLFFCGMMLADIHFELEGVGAPGKAPAAAAASAAAAATLAADSNGAAEMAQIGPNGEATTTTAAAPAGASAYAEPAEAAAAPWYTRRDTVLGVVAFVFCLYLLSIPDAGRGAANTPGYETLVRWAPEYHKERGQLDAFYIPLGAVFLVLAIDRTPVLQKLFTHPFSQYLGKISYSMYLIHGAMIWTVGHWAARKGVAITGAATQWQYGLGIAISAVVMWTCTVFLADLATRTIDKRAVELGRIVYERCVQKEQAPVLPRTAR